MKRREFIKTAGVATVVAGMSGLALANPTPDEHIPWEEIERIIKDCGFDYSELNETLLPLDRNNTTLQTSEKNQKSYYRFRLPSGNLYHLGFERLENKEGKGKLTYLYFSFQEQCNHPEGDFGSWTEYPICRFYMSPQNWEAELREAISSGFSKKFGI